MEYDYDKNEIKEKLSLDQIEEFLEEFHGEPERRGEIIVSRTICHCGNSHKLYYYPNTNLFKCYTDCSDTFDIFELTRKVLSREQPKAREDPDWNLPEAIEYIATKFGFAPKKQENFERLSTSEDLILFNEYERINNININTQEVELKEYPSTVLKNLPRPKIQPWLNENIKQEIMDLHNICYDPKNQGIVIPHYDINDRLVGIRERTLIQEQAEKYGKYLPAKIGGKMYNHPLSFNLYNLNFSKKNITYLQKAIVFESEKSCLKYASYFGEENDISCAICGSSFINYQAWLLINLGVKEIIVALDHDFTDLSSDVAQRQIKNLKQIHNKYGKFVNISFLWDKNNLLGYKDSPIDKTPEIFITLFKNRINLY